MARAADIEDVYPLAPVQKGMLFHSIAEPRSGMYVVQLGYELKGAFDVAAGKKAWDHVVARHPALRTSFAWQSLDDPRQVVHRQVTLPWREEDLRAIDPAEQRAYLESVFAEDRRRGFDLAAAPLIRLALFRLSDETSYLLWTRHHILLDGWSTPLVLQEWSKAYAAMKRGADPALPPARPFRDYIAWLEKRDVARTEGYWRGVLKGFTAPTPLGLDKPALGGHEQADEYEREALELPAPLAQAVSDLARKRGLTMNMVVQGAWALVLARLSRTRDVLFGTTTSGRPADIPGVDGIVGMFLNTLAVRIDVDPKLRVGDWLAGLQRAHAERLSHDSTPLYEVQRWSDVPRGVTLFESLLLFENFPAVAEGGEGPSSGLAFGESRAAERTNYPLTVYVMPNLWVAFDYEVRRFDRPAILRLVAAFRAALEALVADPNRTLDELSVVPAEDVAKLERWNATDAPIPDETIVAQLARRVAATPDAPAVSGGGVTLTYRQLDERARRVAAALRSRGVGADDLVGLFLERSVDLVVAMIGILRAGAAYVPLDPTYPRERVSYMAGDSKMRVAVTQRALRPLLPAGVDALVVEDAASWPTAVLPDTPAIAPRNLAYVIYTSGSTGQPKGTMLEHREVVNFFAAMDARLPAGPPPVFGAVTSVSFDISVLELIYPLTRGGHVVVVPRLLDAGQGAGRRRASGRPLDFSLFYFGASTAGADAYRLVLDGARFADEHGFAAVWTPERHFHPFGGAYPSPAVLGAAVAAITRRISIRAGSVVSPLHHPARLAEDWAVVDNLSGGRAGVSFASGWHARDFLFAPDKFEARRAQVAKDVETVRALWRGEERTFSDGRGQDTAVRIFPQPIQASLPMWLTAAGSPATFALAGQLGVNLLTHLLGQDLDELTAKIASYRRAWKDAGHPGEGHVTIMAHTFVGDDTDAVRAIVRPPLIEYLKQSADLLQGGLKGLGTVEEVRAEDLEEVAALSFDRYFTGESSGLFGTPERCLAAARRLEAAGADEIACLIDFGVDADRVLAMLTQLDQVRAQAQTTGEGLAELITTHHVTHLQCTPSLARSLVEEPETLAPLRAMLVGGEAFPRDLAAGLREVVPGALVNMYGPTETTIWSSTHEVARGESGATVSLGKPIANNTFHVLNDGARAPIGVPGELFIGGDGVARGYLERPALTAERFVPDPFAKTPGARMYRTGDLVRWTADGTLEFLGRLDQQVKIRGHRVELAEIEAVLATHPAVRESVVVVRSDGARQTLTGYVVATSASAFDGGELARHVAARVPEWMVPSVWVRLDALPKTPNQKIDRKALPAPDAVAAEARPRVAPSTPAETALAAIWTKVFRLPALGVHDNFFEIGGDSITAMQVVSQARKAGLAITPRQMFSHQTIAELAAVARPLATDKGGAAGPVPLVHAQRVALADPRRGWTVLTWAVEGTLDRPALERALVALAARHDALRVRVRKQGDGWQQELVAAEGAIVLRDAAAESPQRVAAGAAKDGAVAIAIVLGVRAERFALALDPAVFDRRSAELLREDLEDAYGAIRRDAPWDAGPTPPPLATLAGLDAAAPDPREAERWREAATPAAAPPPGDDAEATTRLDATETTRLLGDANQAYGTEPHELVLAALTLALGALTRARTFRIDLEGDARRAAEESFDARRAVGPLATRFPAVVTLPKIGVGNAIRAVKELVRSVPRGGVGHAAHLARGAEELRRALAAGGPCELRFTWEGDVQPGRRLGPNLGLALIERTPPVAPPDPRPRLDVVARVKGQRLEVQLLPAPGVHAAAVAAELTLRLREVLRHCESSDVGGVTPSDFPTAGLNQHQLDKFVQRITTPRERR